MPASLQDTIHHTTRHGGLQQKRTSERVRRSAAWLMSIPSFLLIDYIRNHHHQHTVFAFTITFEFLFSFLRFGVDPRLASLDTGTG